MKRLNFVIFLPIAIASLSGCNASGSRVKSHTRVENVEEYSVDVFNPSNPITTTGEKRNFDFFNDRTIPYLSIEEYVDTYANYIANSQSGALSTSKYVVYTSRFSSTIINSHTDSRCVIDFNRKTATFDSYSGFITSSVSSNGAGDYISTNLDSYYFLDKTYQHQKGVEVVVDFSTYHIDSYFYKNKIYLPIHFMNVLLGKSNPLAVGGIYYNGHRSYYLGGIGLLFGYFDELYQTFLQDIRKDDTTLNDDYMDYNYNVLCFALDFHYGIEKRDYRSTGEEFYFNKNGAYETLKNYKDRLTSKELGVFDDALDDLINNEFNDGGHSKAFSISVTQNKNEVHFDYKNEAGYTLDVHDGLASKRKEMLGLDFDMGIGLENQYSEMKYDDTTIAYISFDSFDMALTAPKLDEPYYTHTFNLVNYANEQIRKNNIKDVVIDLSCNTGGVILAEEIFESWVCGESHSIEYDKNDKSISKVNRKADINLDKIYDEKDYLGDDVNVYCIISPSSFSCGNLLPYRLKEYSNTKFIGSRSGGGCCSVETYLNLPNGAFLNISSIYSSISKDSTQNNIVTVDDGVYADFIKIEDGEEHYGEFFDRDSINKAIVESHKK